MARKRNRLQRRSNAILWRFLAVNLIILTVPMVVSGLYYGIQVRNVEADILQMRTDSLALNKRIIEATIRNIRGILNQVQQEMDLERLRRISDPFNGGDMLQVADIHRQSFLARSSDPYLIDVVVYLNEPGILLTQKDIFFYPERFYPFFYEYPGVAYDRWLETISDGMYINEETSAAVIRYYGEERDVILVRSSLPVTPRITSRGTVIAIIDRSAIMDLVRERLVVDQGFAYIQMADGRMFIEYGTDPPKVRPDIEPARETSGVREIRIDGRPFVVSYLRSDYNNWLYVVGAPREIFLEQSRRLVALFVAATAIIAAVGIPVSVFLAYGFSRPLIRVSEILKNGVMISEHPERDAIRFISNSVSELIRRNSTLRDLIDEQKPYVKNVMIDRLFRGDFSTESELRASMDHFDINIHGSYYGVLCIFIDGYYEEIDSEIFKEFLVKNTLLRKYLVDILPDDSLVHDLSLNRIGCVLVLDHEDPSDCRREMEGIHRDVLAHLNAQKDVRCLVGQGPIVRTLLEVPPSLQEAILRINSSTVQNEPEDFEAEDEIDAGRDVPVTAFLPASDGSYNGGNGRVSGVSTAVEQTAIESVYHYPIEIELRLVTMVSSGRVEEVEEIVRRLKVENLEHRSLSIQIMKGFIKVLESTRLKILNRISVKADFTGIPSALREKSIREVVVGMLDDFIRVAEKLSKSDSQHHRFRKPILDFVDKNYMDPGMSLKKLALEFNLSEVYLSQLFREIAGKNFFAYIEELRMDQAVKLLKSAKLTVDEVSQRVGYNSAHAFRRAFKRKAGISPSAIR